MNINIKAIYLVVCLLCVIGIFVPFYLIDIYSVDLEALSNKTSIFSNYSIPILTVAGSILLITALVAQIRGIEKAQNQFIEQKLFDSKQIFEGKVFRLLDLHKEIINTGSLKWDIFITTRYMDADYFINTVVGYEYNDKLLWIKKNHAVIESYDIFDKSMLMFEWAIFDGNNVRKDIASTEVAQITVNFFYERFSQIFFRYFNNLFYIIVAIDSSEIINNQEKESIIELVQNHLSHSEFKWVLWMSTHTDFIKFQPILEKYTFFNRLKQEDFGHKGYINFREIYSHLK